jgi:polyhydroxyalkanoate synthesis repressor PhaR
LLAFAKECYNPSAAKKIEKRPAATRRFMGRKPASRKAKEAAKETTKEAGPERIIIKRYGNRRLYNTETSSYVTYHDIINIVRTGYDVQVIDSASQDDVTKAVLIQAILEEEKNQKNLLPLPFLLQLIRSQEGAAKDFFSNYLASSFEAYLKTKEEFDRRFRGFLETSTTAPQLWEKLIPGAEAVKEIWGLNKKDEKKK